MAMNFGNFIVVERDSDLQVLRRGTTYEYTMSGSWIFEPGSYVPVVKVGYKCIGIAKIVTVLISETTTAIEFLCVESSSKDDRYNAYYDLFKLMLLNADDGELSDMDAGDLLHPAGGAQVYRNSDPKRGHGSRKVDYSALFSRDDRSERY